ncbi:MAG: polysaccharide biosynthesis protein [Phycisphaerales bacterium]
MASTAILIGTPGSVRTLERQLALLSNPPVVLGCVLHAADTSLRVVRDVPVLGPLEQLESICAVKQPSTALLSLPSAMSDLVMSVRTRLRRLGIADRFFPTLEDQLNGVGPRSAIDVDLQALIGRPARVIDESSVARVIRGRTVVVTGAGGSIGTELCRIAASFDPASLVMVERSENALFEIDRQIARKWPALRRRAALHDVVDATATKELFAAVRPDVVFHAAAHKHVPMSEDHPGAALDNNLFGTISTVDAAVSSGAERFVMVSTDKAVNPTSVMGMTKRLAELYVQHVHRHGQGKRERRTGCSMVRFGNVLGSSGSVLDTWKRQIADGGPITVTDPRMTRYFMSIPEAAALVIQSAALHDPQSVDGEVFVLDMGEPLRVMDLAVRFIEAHGLVARLPERHDAPRQASAPRHSEVGVVVTGIRPGEKLFEELALDREAIRPTRHPDIRIWGLPSPDPAMMVAMVQELSHGQRPREPRAIAEAIRRYVPEARMAEATSIAA